MKQYSLFISHAWTYSDAYQKFCALLDNDPYFHYRNYSIPKDDPVHNAPNEQLLYDAIKNKISYCQIVIIMAGKYSTYSKWIQKEIKIAKYDFKKPVLAVKPWANTQVSDFVRQRADMLVNWNSSSIISAIRDLINI